MRAINTQAEAAGPLDNKYTASQAADKLHQPNIVDTATPPFVQPIYR